MDPRLQALLDKQAIREVVYRYCRGIDRYDLELVRSCYHPGATDDHGSFSGPVDEFLLWVDRLLSRYTLTMHLVGNVLIELDESGDTAACETYGVSLHKSDDPKPYMNLATGFRYLDRFERRDDEWRIAERTAVGEWSLRIPAEAWWSIPESHLQGQRNPNDAIYSLLASLHPTS
jgi:hypothetical protein